MEYFLSKALPVGCGLFAIAAASVFGRWASRVHASIQCPCAVVCASGTGAVGAAGTSTGVQSTMQPRCPRSVECGRPNMAELIEKAIAEVEAAPAPNASSLTAGLYVCVCGPAAMVQSCKDSVKKARRQHRRLPIGLHAEEPDW